MNNFDSDTEMFDVTGSMSQDCNGYLLPKGRIIIFPPVSSSMSQAASKNPFDAARQMIDKFREEGIKAKILPIEHPEFPEGEKGIVIVIGKTEDFMSKPHPVSPSVQSAAFRLILDRGRECDEEMVLRRSVAQDRVLVIDDKHFMSAPLSDAFFDRMIKSEIESEDNGRITGLQPRHKHNKKKKKSGRKR